MVLYDGSEGSFFFFSFFTSPFLKTIASIVYKKGKGKKKWRNYFSLKKKKEEENTVFQKPSNLQDSNSALMVVYEVTTHRSSILKDLMDAFRSNKVI